MVNEVGEECGEYDDKRGKDSPTLPANVRTGHSPISLESSQLVQLCGRILHTDVDRDPPPF